MQVLHTSGNTTVSSILKKYEVTLQLDKDTTVTEWMQLKQAGKCLGVSSVYDLVQIVNTSNPVAYSNINKVVNLSLTLPLSIEACERGFSSQLDKNQVQISSETCSSLCPDAHSSVKVDRRDI